jgi:hypothetical protein
MRWSHLVKSTAAVAMIGVAACSDSGPNNRPITLSFSSQASAAAMTADRAPDYDITVTIGPNTVVITKAQLVIRKMELKQNAATTCPDDDQSHADCDELKLGPMLVDLPLTATASTAITAAVPEGTYNEIEFQIHRPTNNTSDATFAAANPNFANASIRVEGTYNGSAFVFTSQISQSMELEFNPPVVINADNKNVTIALDINSWFKVNGAVINPTTANPGQPNEQAVSQNIKASLHAFEDDDRNGR